MTMSYGFFTQLTKKFPKMKFVIIFVILMCASQALGFCEPNQIFRSQCNWCTCDAFGTTASCSILKH